MSKRVCKRCNIEKPHTFSHLNPQARAVYLDDRNLPWNGKECSQCKSSVNKGKYTKKPPKTYHKVCKYCQDAFTSANIATKYCSKPTCQENKPKLTALNAHKAAKKALKLGQTEGNDT